MFFLDKVAAAVAEGGSLFPRCARLDRGSRRQKVHRTVARARFQLENVQKLRHWEHFWKMRSAKCARNCSESSISHKKRRDLSHSETWSKGMQALGWLDMTCRCSISVSNLPANSCFVVGPSCLCCNFRNQLLTSTYPMRDHMDIRLTLIKEAIWGRKFPPGDTLTLTSAWNSGYDTVLEPGLQSHDCPQTSNQQSKTFSA